MKIETVPAMDVGWLWMDSKTTPMVPALLCVFRLPADAQPDFVTRLVDKMRGYVVPTQPFDRRRRRLGLGRVVCQWEIVEEIDPTYHLRHSRLPHPGSHADLMARISQLHSLGLDESRPLWSVDMIEGLEDRRFAMFLRMHHSLIDGISVFKYVAGCLATSADERDWRPIWAYRGARLDGTAASPDRTTGAAAPQPEGTPRRRRRGDARQALSGLAAAADAIGGAASGLSARPWRAPRSALNRCITPDRLILTQMHEMTRYRALCERTGGTVNDVVLAVCAGALRRYLAEVGQLPNRSLTALFPISVRTRQRKRDAATALSHGTLLLRTEIADVHERLHSICAATAQIKVRLARMGDVMVDVYSLLAFAPVILHQVTRIGGRARPPFNVLISNIPGPPERLYWNGAPMESAQAIPVLFRSTSLIIAVTSYVDQVNFGFTMCPSTLPRCTLLAGCFAEALTELELSFPR